MPSTFAFDLQVPIISSETGTGQFIMDLLPPSSPDFTFQHPASAAFETVDYTLPIVAGVIGVVAVSAVALYGLWNLDKLTSVAQGGLELGKGLVGQAKGIGNPLKVVTDAIEGLGKSVKNILPST